MRSSGRMLITCLAVLVLGPVLAFGNGFYSPTVGPRASAMGGAFIGLADAQIGLDPVTGRDLMRDGVDPEFVALGGERNTCH